jgi:hypothetical protein
MADISGDSTLEEIFNSGILIEWQSWPWGLPQPELFACGKVQAYGDMLNKLTEWYPNFAWKVCDCGQVVPNADMGEQVWPSKIVESGA